MKKLDTELNFRDWGNSEIMCEWYVLGIKAGYSELRPSIEKFLNKVGRRKYLMPIYTALTKDAENLKWAQQVFERAKGHYHFVSKSSVEALLYKK